MEPTFGGRGLYPVFWRFDSEDFSISVPVSFSNVSFLGGAATLSQLPEDLGAEVAFAGRSNAGKSSAINTITRSKSLARIGKTPGRTREINFFRLAEGLRLVDLPGYGYAKVPKRMKAHWGQLIADYLVRRVSLRGVVVIMDARRPFTDLDQQLVDWCAAAGLPVHVLLTKCDKLSRGAGQQALSKARRLVSGESLEISLQLFSALKSVGAEEARNQLIQWLNE